MVREVVEARAAMYAPPPGSTPTRYVEPEGANHGTIDSSTLIAEANTTSSENTDHSIDEDNSNTDKKEQFERVKTAEAPSTTAAEAAQTSAPAWINDEPTLENGVYRAAVVSGPYSTRRECEIHLDEALRQAIMEYAESHQRHSARYTAWMDIGYVRNNMIEERYLAEEHKDKIPYRMYNLHVRLKVEPRDVARFEELARRHEERRAVETASAGGVFVLGALVVLYGGLRFIGRRKRPSPPDPAPTAPADATA
jgi:hypothetical protein